MTNKNNMKKKISKRVAALTLAGAMSLGMVGSAYATENVVLATKTQEPVKMDLIANATLFENYFRNFLVSMGIEYNHDELFKDLYDDLFEKENETDTEIEKGNYIGYEAALKIAVEHAGVTEVKIEKNELDIDDNKVVEYDIEFSKDGIEYEYEIDAVTGKVINFEKDRNDDVIENTDEEIQKGDYIGYKKALEIALNHAGVTDVNLEKNKLDRDDDDNDKDVEYEIEFNKDGIEYEYEIDAFTGEVLNFEKEQNDDMYDDLDDLDDMYDMYDDDNDDDDDDDDDDDNDDDDDDDDDDNDDDDDDDDNDD